MTALKIPSRMPVHAFVHPLGREYVHSVRSSPGSQFAPQPLLASPLAPCLINLSPLLPVPSPNPTCTPLYPAGNPIWPLHRPLQGNPNLPSPAMNGIQTLSAIWTPGTFPAQPFGSFTPLQLNPHIIYNPNNPSIPVLQWDVTHPPEVAKLYTGRHTLIPMNLEETVIIPDTVRKIVICSDFVFLAVRMEKWGPIVVEKIDEITIRDVLDAIHNYLQKPLTYGEMAEIGRFAGNIDNLQSAAYNRVRDSYELRSAARKRGFKRIDMLGPNRRFQGLRPVVFQDNTWKLFMGLLPTPVPPY